MNIIILKGLPASGKSTWARELMDKEPDTYKRINKDSLRDMVDFGNYSKNNEMVIRAIRDILIVRFFEMGYSIIIDDTNMNPTHIEDIVQLVGDYEDNCDELELGSIGVYVQEFLTPLVECIARDKHRELNSVGSKVIKEMNEKYPKTLESGQQVG